MQVCPNCHRKMSDGAKFCGFCASPMPNASMNESHNGEFDIDILEDDEDITNVMDKKGTDHFLSSMDDEVTHVANVRHAVKLKSSRPPVDSRDNTVIDSREHIAAHNQSEMTTR